MQFKDYAGFMGISAKQLRRYELAGRLTGVNRFNERFAIVNTETARILPPPNTERRTTGKVIGRSKPLRGEEGFKEK